MNWYKKSELNNDREYLLFRGESGEKSSVGIGGGSPGNWWAYTPWRCMQFANYGKGKLFVASVSYEWIKEDEMKNRNGFQFKTNPPNAREVTSSEWESLLKILNPKRDNKGNVIVDENGVVEMNDNKAYDEFTKGSITEHQNRLKHIFHF